MLSGSVTTMLAALADSSDARTLSEKLKRFGRALLDTPAEAAAVLEALAGVEKAGPREDRLSHLLASALDEARMARESGQHRGAAFIEALEAQVGRLVAKGLSFTATLALSGTWVRAGLTPPASLGARQDGGIEPLDGAQAAELDGLLDSLLGTLVEESGGSVSAIHTLFAEMLPTVPPEARRALVRSAVARPPEMLAELGCAWLLDPGAEVRLGAAEGLADRLAAGRLSGGVLGRLTILRSWLADGALRDRLDALIREAMRRGIGASAAGPAPRVHRVVASLVDGSGAQSIAAAVQTGGSRTVAMVLLKQGFGVKDAYVLPCTSASDQRGILSTITDEVEARDVPLDYMAQAIGLALSEGLEGGLPPVPGLVDVARTCGLAGLRPIPASVGAILSLADPGGRVAALSARARGALITASETWEDDYPMLASWFEDSDEVAAALGGANSRAAMSRGMWSVLETRRGHWATLIARNALLLATAGSDGADAFVAVAAALAEGRELKKIPVMKLVCDQSIAAWEDRGIDFDAGFPAAFDPAFAPPLGGFPPDRAAPPSPPAEKKGEMARLLRPAGLTEPWLQGYLAGVCTAPRFVPPPDWMGPLLHLASEGLTTDRKMQRFVELLMLRYNDSLAQLARPEAALVPGMALIPIWADGYLTAWEATKPHWPAKALGPEGKAVRRLLEQATEDRIAPDFAATVPAWLRQRHARQQMPGPRG